MHSLRLIPTTVAILALCVSTPLAQGKSGSAPKGGGPKATSPSTGGNKGGGPAKTTGGAPTTNTGPGKSASAAGHAMPGNAGHGNGASKKSTTTPAANAGTATPGTGGTTAPAGAAGTTVAALPNPISLKIANKPELMAKVTGLLPAGMTLEQASAGFRNQGQFIAALNASKNRGLPFAELQKAMTIDGLSLGQAAKAVQALPPPALTPDTTTSSPAAAAPKS
jgi:hypothetical protein